MTFPALSFATPRKLPSSKELSGRVVVLDLAFAAEGTGTSFEKVTKRLIDGLGPRLALWVDHHDHALHDGLVKAAHTHQRLGDLDTQGVHLFG